jgi:hypothetical protein
MEGLQSMYNQILRMNNIVTAIEYLKNNSHKMLEKNNNYAVQSVKMAIDALESQLTNGWIPVTERLPEEGRYLVTTVYGEVKESEFGSQKWWQIDNSMISLVWEEEPSKVVAWQPLPEPYKEVSEGGQ